MVSTIAETGGEQNAILSDHLTVLSEEPITDYDLDAIAYQIDQGDCVGGPLTAEQNELTGKQAADALHQFGSEPSFFQLDDNGNRLRDSDDADPDAPAPHMPTGLID